MTRTKSKFAALTRVAGDALEKIASESQGSNDRRLANAAKVSAIKGPIYSLPTYVHQDPDWMQEAQARIYRMQEPLAWRLVQAAGEDGTAHEEMIFTVHGILCSADLPPVSEKPE